MVILLRKIQLNVYSINLKDVNSFLAKKLVYCKSNSRRIRGADLLAKIYAKSTPQKQIILEILVILIIAFPSVLKLTFLVDPIKSGCDTWTHLYKAQILKTQLKTLPIQLWGSWDWSWHAGYEFLDVYSPLPYYFLTLPSLLGVSLEIMFRVLILSVILTAAFSIYFLCKKLTTSYMLGFFGVVFFLYSPIFITTLNIWGNVGKFVAYSYASLALLFAEKLAKNGRREQVAKYAFVSAITLASCILSNMAVGIWVLLMYCVWLIRHCSFIKAVTMFIGLSCMSFLLSAFYLLPMLYARVTILPVVDVSKGSAILSFLFDTILRGNFLAWILLSVLLIEIWHDPKKKLDTNVKVLFYFLSFYLLYNIFAILTEDILPALSIIRGDRSLIVILVCFSVFPVYLIKIVNQKFAFLRKIIYGIAIAIIIEGMLIPPYYPLQEEKYFLAADYISKDPMWCRYAFLPREPIASVLPAYSGKPYIDGWSFLSDPEIFSVLGTAVTRFERIEKLIAENGSAGLGILEYLGVKYVIVERSDPIYGYELSNAIYDSINSSELALSRYSQGSVTVFEILNFSIVHAYQEVPQDFETAIYNKLPTDSKLVVCHVVQRENEFYLELDVNIDSLYIVIPVVNSAKLETYVNNVKVDTFHAYANLIAVYLPTNGTYQISIRLKEFQLVRIWGAVLSISTLVCGSAYVGAVFIKSKYEKNKDDTKS